MVSRKNCEDRLSHIVSARRLAAFPPLFVRMVLWNEAEESIDIF